MSQLKKVEKGNSWKRQMWINVPSVGSLMLKQTLI